MSKPKTNTYAFDLVTWKKGMNYQTPNGTYFIECEHFPSSNIIDNYIINNYNECKKAGRNQTDIFSSSLFCDIITIGTINSCWFQNASRLYFTISESGENKTFFMEYLNIRKI